MRVLQSAGGAVLAVLTASIGLTLVFAIDGGIATIESLRSTARVEPTTIDVRPPPDELVAGPVIEPAPEPEAEHLGTMNADLVGCWSGMDGGRLRISEHRIDDLGSGETSFITHLGLRPEVDTAGIETGVVYVFETSGRFRKSFLARIVKFSFNRDETVGVTTYDSLDDYFSGKISGMGLFGRYTCDHVTGSASRSQLVNLR